jgi:hypothetical protein
VQLVNDPTPNVPVEMVLHAVVGPVIVPLGAVGSTNVIGPANVAEPQLFCVITKFA